MKLILIYVAILLCCEQTFAQTTGIGHNMPMLRLAAYDLDNANAFSFGLNQASLASVKKFSLAMASERRFMLEEIRDVVFLLALPTDKGNFGFTGSLLGNSQYSENLFGLTYARKLMENLDIGAQFNYYSRNIENYGRESAIHAAAGLILHLNENFTTGIHIYNPTGVAVGKTSERLPSVYSLGWGYAPSGKFFLAVDIQKVEDQPVSLHAEFHYRIVDGLRLSAGMTSAASSYYFAAGFQWKHFFITVSTSAHQVLGWSPGLSFIYCQGT